MPVLSERMVGFCLPAAKPRGGGPAKLVEG
jgi:hypothetical protein